ncbi:MAG: LOG family protein [Lapillicoccus sp.]
MEIDDVRSLAVLLERDEPLGGLRLQDLDLRAVEDRLMQRSDLAGLVVLGGTMTPTLGTHLREHGAIVFPVDPAAPVSCYRAHLYTPAELYAGLDGPGGYAGTPDARAYQWSRAARASLDAYATLLCAIHDDSVTDALDEFVAGRRVVGVMGGHAAARGSEPYAVAARLGFELAGAGYLVATGGGPGSMEAANLGAVAPDQGALDAALGTLARVPAFTPDTGAWASLGFEVLGSLGRLSLGPLPAPAPGGGTVRARSIGIPTWFYGHEPPNVFCDGVAKYFSNALREDGLLARCTAGVVVLEGAAGTVQEVFQASTRLYYAAEEARLPPLVLVGRRYWSQRLPVWQALQALAAGRGMAGAIHLVDGIDEVLDVLDVLDMPDMPDVPDVPGSAGPAAHPSSRPGAASAR